ncbi:hypothetical protein NZD89_03230 [Alicyclobacillus fastidiosus]|uniref:Uncharacterized protein n=1 Tax=Alicyclobacillus fastidiosus TaxID=392011 RepID=A0ABY6ZJ55_9BACL|nr:hypothetical protein [Alicyclobacillus fastidiosus]WAH42517.1 hypothetical protein NZD89_03230 [Alicyclobacillus fastidiosus]GMA64358.1 hypothetical protein GCM10025859_47980 [Alicyclobacillus fastidiosus]
MFRNWIHRKDAATFAAIQERLQHIELALQQMTNQGAKNSIHIDTLHVHDPVLEKLEFRLDQLDIDELSGALNLGNNFGVRVGRTLHLKKKGFTPEGKTAQAERNLSDLKEGEADGSKMQKTNKGFTFRFT